MEVCTRRPGCECWRREGTIKRGDRGKGRMRDGSRFSFALRVIEMAFYVLLRRCSRCLICDTVVAFLAVSQPPPPRTHQLQLKFSLYFSFLFPLGKYAYTVFHRSSRILFRVLASLRKRFCRDEGIVTKVLIQL